MTIEECDFKISQDIIIVNICQPMYSNAIEQTLKSISENETTRTILQDIKTSLKGTDVTKGADAGTSSLLIIGIVFGAVVLIVVLAMIARKVIKENPALVKAGIKAASGNPF